MENWETDQIRKGAGKIAIGFSLMMILTVIFQLGFSLLLQRFWPDALYEEWVTWLLLLIQYLVGIPAVLLCVRRVPSVPPKKQRFRPGLLAEYFVVGYALMYLGNLIGQGINFVMSRFLEKGIANGVENIVTDSSLWLNLILVSVAAPIIEEFLFRKLIIDRLWVCGERVAVLTSALMFGLFHGNLYQFFYAFFVGIIFGLIYARSGRLRYTIGLHIILNSMGSLVSTFVLEADLLWLTAVYGILLLAVVAVGIVFLIADRKYFRFRPSAFGYPEEGWKRNILGSGGMIFFYLCCLGLFLYNLLI